MQANAAAKKQQLLEAQARAQAEAQAAADAMMITLPSTDEESFTPASVVPKPSVVPMQEVQVDKAADLLNASELLYDRAVFDLTPRQKAARERLDAAKARANAKRVAMLEKKKERLENKMTDAAAAVFDSSNMSPQQCASIIRSDTPPPSLEEKWSKDNVVDNSPSSPISVADVVTSSLPSSHPLPQLSVAESTSASASTTPVTMDESERTPAIDNTTTTVQHHVEQTPTKKKLSPKERLAAAKARATTQRLAAGKQERQRIENESIKAAASSNASLASSTKQRNSAKVETDAKLKAKQKAEEEWTMREQAARNEWLAEQECLAQLEAEKEEANGVVFVEQPEEKKRDVAPANNTATPVVKMQARGLKDSLGDLLSGLPSVNSSNSLRSLAKKKKSKGIDDDDDASVFTTLTKKSLYSTATKTVTSHYSRAHEVAAVVTKVKEEHARRQQQLSSQQQDDNTRVILLKTAPQWERYFLQDAGRVFSSDENKLWSASSFKYNRNGIIKRGKPLRGMERLKATKIYLDNADDLDRRRSKFDDIKKQAFSSFKSVVVEEEEKGGVSQEKNVEDVDTKLDNDAGEKQRASFPFKMRMKLSSNMIVI